jgi:TfoX/Sxy family transcriptional regulator of competence genes
MAYDEGVAQRIREALADEQDLLEKKMFGGVAFMLRGNMCCGVVGDELMLRVGPDGYEDALARRHARPMDFTGRAMKGMIYVASKGFEADEDLEGWLARATAFAGSLPPK